MEESRAPALVRFGTFEVDLRAGTLRRNGVKVRLPEQSFRVLAALLARPGEVVTREQLRLDLWPDETFVDFDNSINAAVNRLREALGDSAASPRFVATLPRRGYMFIAPVQGPRRESRGVESRDQGTEATSPTEPASAPNAASVEAPPTRQALRSHRWGLRPTAGVVALAVIVVGSSVWLFRERRGPSPSPTHRQVTFVGDTSFPAISPDGRFLAYVTRDGSASHQKLMVQDLSGGQPLQVFEGQRLEQPAWSHDGSELLIWSLAGVRIVPRFGGSATSVGRSLYRRSWSPDNSQFAGINQGVKQIFLVDRRTGASTQIPLSGSFAFMHAVDWSPTGSLLLFETLDKQERYAIWSIRPDGRQQEKLIEDEIPISSPRWSSTGDSIYYFRGGDTRELLKLPVSLRNGKATGPPQVLLAGLQAGGWFTISGDGRQLAYTRRFGQANLWAASTKLSPGGASGAKQLTSGTARDLYPNISPQGRQVAFSRGEGDRANIFVVPIGGGKPEQITFLKSRNLSPVWSPDGRTIAFGSTEGGHQWVWQVGATGGMPPRALEQTRLSTDTFHMAWAPSPWIVYHEPGNRNFQVLHPMTGEQHPLVGDSSVGWMFDACSSPDGSQVAVSWNRALGGLWLIPIGKSSQGTLLASQGGAFGTVSQVIDASALRGREVKLTAYLKTEVSGAGNQGQCWLRVDRANGKRGFFDNMQDRSVRSATWNEVTIAGKIDDDAEWVAFGCLLKGTGRIWVDDIQLQTKGPGGRWNAVPIKNPGFEETDDRIKPAGWNAVSPGYVFQVTDASPHKGRGSLVIGSTHIVGSFDPLGWSADGKNVYAIEQEGRIVMIRTDRASMRPIVDLPLPEGSTASGGVAITADGQRVVYSAQQTKSDVWIVQNFDPTRSD